MARFPVLRSRAVTAGALLASIAALTVGRAAVADGTAPSDEDRANARAFGAAGVALAMQGKCDEAIPKLQAAEKLFHAPTTAEPLGECLVKTGKVIAGTELLNRTAREALPPNAPPAFVQAQQRASTEYDDGVKKVAKLRIHVAGAQGAKDLAVQVDGEHVDAALLDNDRLTDPGQHTVTATATGYTNAQAQVTLKEGETQDLPLTIAVDPNYHPPAPVPTTTAVAPTATQTAPPPPPPPPPAPNRVPAIVALGAGGVGLVVGGVFGVMALSSKSTLDSACGSNKAACPSSSQSDIDSLHTNSLVSTIGFGVGIVGLALGGYLWFSATPKTERTAAVTVHPWVGPTSVGLAGGFQ